jgi:hypothetical protein
VTQDQAITLAFKVVEVASVVTIGAFVACYSAWARWWENAIGRTIVAKDMALILVLLPSILSIFLHFNRLTSHVAAWFDLASLGAIPVIMVWRIIVWRKIHKAGQLPRDDSEGPWPGKGEP